MSRLSYGKWLLVLHLPASVLAAAYLGWANDPVVRSAHISPVIDPSDLRRLVGFSDAVFVGRVVEEIGHDVPEDAPFPRTQFRAEVVATIKARRRVNQQLESEPSVAAPLGSWVTVDQYGGYSRDPSGKQVLELMEGMPLLVPGEMYLLSTRYDPVTDRYHVLEMQAAAILLDADAKAKIDQYEAAKSDEVPYEIDDPHYKSTP
ncbi:MAG: hypothetical protein H0V86_02235 [Chloroflexia bacterium]|nr:hypothetical protein [Chloroflexia bacterium]